MVSVNICFYFDLKVLVLLLFKCIWISFSFKEIFETVGGILGVKTPTFYLPKLLMSILAIVFEKISYITNSEPLLTPEKVTLMNNSMRVSSKKAEEELGFSTCSMLEMYKDCYEWMQKEKMI